MGTVLPRKRTVEAALPSEDYVRKAMPHRLGTFDMTMIFLMMVFFINDPVGTVGSGTAAFSYWIVGLLVFFFPCIIATAQLGTMFPYEASLYNWTQKALGSFWSFFVGISFWAAGILGMVGSAGIAVSFLQGLNGTWLAEPRLQGVLIVFILIISSILALQRFSMVQRLVNMTMILMMGVIALLGLAAFFWLLTGHPVATNFGRASDLTMNPGNFALFSTVILAFLGVNVSMTMGGEIADRTVISRHLFRGGLLVFIGYMIVTFALLVVQGPHATIGGPISVINTIDRVFGKSIGNLASACVIAFFIVFAALLNSAFGRLLLVAAIDRRLPIGLGKLDNNRVPLNAIMFQTTIGVLFAALVFLSPYIITFGNPVNLANELFTVSLYAQSQVWTIASAFLFIDLLFLYLRDRQGFHAQRIFSMPLLAACMIVAPLACIFAIIVTLSYSPIPQLIPTGQWGYVVGGLTLIWVVCAAIGSMLASSEAAWEDSNVEG